MIFLIVLEYLYNLAERDYKYHTVEYDEEKIKFVEWLMVKLRLGSWGFIRFYKIIDNIYEWLLENKKSKISEFYIKGDD